MKDFEDFKTTKEFLFTSGDYISYSSIYCGRNDNTILCKKQSKKFVFVKTEWEGPL